VLDTTLQAFRLAEAVNLPVMIVLDAFFLSHTYEPVDIPDESEVAAFLPPYQPRFAMSTDAPCAMGQLAPPSIYMELRHNIHQAMQQALDRFAEIDGELRARFGRGYGPVEAVGCEGAEIVLVTSGTVTSTARQVVEDLRAAGEKVGLLKIKLFRPFPVDAVRRHLLGVPRAAVVDRNFSFGAGGIFAQEVKASLYGQPGAPLVYGFVAGLGGRDVTEEVLMDILKQAREGDVPVGDSIWVGLREVQP
jgi:pyruvate ferredoxin oxidoreductase alpha subunit